MDIGDKLFINIEGMMESKCGYLVWGTDDRDGGAIARVCGKPAVEERQVWRPSGACLVCVEHVNLVPVLVDQSVLDEKDAEIDRLSALLKDLRPTWEYRVQHILNDDILKQLGSDGWEMCGYVNTALWYFKRRM